MFEHWECSCWNILFLSRASSSPQHFILNSRELQYVGLGDGQTANTQMPGLRDMNINTCTGVEVGCCTNKRDWSVLVTLFHATLRKHTILDMRQSTHSLSPFLSRLPQFQWEKHCMYMMSKKNTRTLHLLTTYCRFLRNKAITCIHFT